MTWQEFNQAQLTRLLSRLREHYVFYADFLKFLKMYNFPPDHPLRIEAERSLKQTREFGEIVRKMLFQSAGYRPLVDPWKTRGLAANLRPDFRARGIE